MVFHSYVLFPIILKLKAGKRTMEFPVLNKDEFPFISILVSAFNEEAVIEEKIESVFKSDYPTDKFELLIGSDNSSDQTNEIVVRMAKQYPNLVFKPYAKR